MEIQAHNDVLLVLVDELVRCPRAVFSLARLGLKMSQTPDQRILNCLEEEYPRDLSIEEIAKKTSVHRNTVSKYLWGLERERKVKISRKIGRAKMYILNKDKR
jgi:response regulator of citrate/malate metabolism